MLLFFYVYIFITVYAINMKNIFLLFLCFILFNCYAQKHKPVLIIFDTDIAPDYDDVGAMAMLHAFADRGEAKILATISSNSFETTVPTISLLNTYFNRPDIPIGIVKDSLPNKLCQQFWAQGIIAKYPHAFASNNDAMDAVKLYRKILAAQADKSVTVLTVGFFINLAGLLKSQPDEFSTLTGKIFSPLFHVTSIVRLLSTPFNLAQTFAAARAVLFCPKSITVYRLPSILMMSPERMSAVVAIMCYLLTANADCF